MKHAPRSNQHHDLYRKCRVQDSEISGLLGECGFNIDETDLVSEASFVADLGADSLDIVEISMAIEKEFGIEIFDDDIESTKTLGDLELLIDTKSQVTM